MKEIGGYLGFEDLNHKEFYPNLNALNTGCNALHYVIKAYKIKKIFIPYYLCNSIENMLLKNNILFDKYHINENFEPIFNKKLATNEYIMIVNYYGQICTERVQTLQNKYKNIILDNTQAFFQKTIGSMPTFYSCRKFFGVPDGAYLATEKSLNEEIETDVSKDRMKHILGRYEGCASDYYSYFKQNDAVLADEPIKLMSRLTRNILGAIDYQKVIDKRNENFKYLNDKLKDKNSLELIIPNGPFAYPFYSENAVEIRQNLAEKKIYIPILWPNVIDSTPNTCIEHKYAANIIPLPCDQRYDKKDMDKILFYLTYSNFSVNKTSFYLDN